jgi:hypothetical protein
MFALGGGAFLALEIRTPCCSVLHGVAESFLEALKINGNFLQRVQHDLEG